MKNLRAALAAVAVGAVAALSMTACSVAAIPELAAVAAPSTAPVVAAPIVPVVAPPTTTSKKPTPKKQAAQKTTVPKKPKTSTNVVADRCTNQIDYASDPRDNATINTIGEQTGKCPKPLTSSTGGTGGGKGAGYGGSSASGGNYSGTDPNYEDINGDTYYSYCKRMGYEPGPSCPAS